MSVCLATCLDKSSHQEALSRPQQVIAFDPLADTRWQGLLQRNARASLFHSSSWLRALQKTYQYEPVAYTTSSPSGEIWNAILFCRVSSWLTGRRLVSLPFSDYCEPLVDSDHDARVLAEALERECYRESWDYIELRPLQRFDFPTKLQCTTVNYNAHELDLRPSMDELFANFHKSSIQRKIRRAERERLIYREGSSEEFVDQFYRLFLMTRKRHKLPPQSKVWFANLAESFGDSLKIRLAFQGERAVAGIITIAFKGTMSYKYGASDARYNMLGGVHLLLWRAIQDAKSRGMSRFDFGRTNADQKGLIVFKNRWGASASVMTYSRYSASALSTHFFDLSTRKWKAASAKYVLSHLPQRMTLKIGQLLYRHAG